MVSRSRFGCASVYILSGIAALGYLPQSGHGAPLAQPLPSPSPSPSLSTSDHRLQPRMNVSIGLSFDAPSIRTSLEAMLLLIDSDAPNRFITVNKPTSFGSDDAVESNKDLSDEVDVVFSSPSTSNSKTTVRPGWVDTYTDFLVEIGGVDLPSLEEQDQIIDEYWDAVKEVAQVQAKLVNAYNDANNGGVSGVTNIGVDLPDTDVLEPLTVAMVEKWAAGKFGKSARKEVKESSGQDGSEGETDIEDMVSGGDVDTNGNEDTTGSETGSGDAKDTNGNSGSNGDEDSGEDDSVFTQADYNNYLKAKQTLAKITPEYQEITEENKIASQGYLYKQLIPTYPGIQNLSMIVGGTPNSRQAKYSAAWSAVIINTTSVSPEDANELQGNLNNSSMNSTVDDTPTATSINFDAPPESSTASLARASGNGTASVSALDSSGLAATATASKSASKSGFSSSHAPTSKSSISVTSSSSSSKAAAASSTASKRAVSWSSRGVARRFPVPAPASSPLAVRGTKSYLTPRSSASAKKVSNALQLAAQSQSKKTKASSSSSSSASASDSSDSLLDPSTAGIIKGSKNRIISGSKQVANPGTTTFSPINSSNSSDPLSGIPDIPLQGTMELLSLREGAWANNRSDFLAYAKKAHPEVFGKYFGGYNSSNGDEGEGPIGRHWTHLVIITTYEGNSSVQTVTMLGKVYDVLPELKGVKGQGKMGDKGKGPSSSSSVSASVSTSGSGTLGLGSGTVVPSATSATHPPSVVPTKPVTLPASTNSPKPTPAPTSTSSVKPSASASGSLAVPKPRVGVLTGGGLGPGAKVV